ncbi:MAG: hypothetical protein M1465_03355 [Candidatus Marsarchaeota archaeon]|nr:hypothetical protein [Candidatus Marsarchaeota archaeon]
MGMENKKAQSAMEYLMTYGWAILIIAIVLAALYSLGVFNPQFFAPKASSGACSVSRPDGPRTTNFISISGVCNGELPKFVSYSTGSRLSLITNFSRAKALLYWRGYTGQAR